MATKKKKTATSKRPSAKLPSEPIVNRLIRELMLLSAKDQLEVVKRGMNVSLDTDNHGQIIIYTDLMYSDESPSFVLAGEADIIPFETECFRIHCDEEEHECEF